MWLRKGLGVTSDSEIQHPSSPWSQVQGGIHPIETESEVWGIDGTGGAMTGLNPPEAMKPEARGAGREG